MVCRGHSRLRVQIRVLRLLSRCAFDALCKEEVSLTNETEKLCLILKSRVLADVGVRRKSVEP